MAPPVGTDDVSDPGRGGRGQGWQKYFVDEAVVDRLVDYSGSGFDWMSNEYDPPHIAFRAEVDPIGPDTSDWDQLPQIDMFGNFDTDPEGVIQGTGSAFTVLQSLKALGLSVSFSTVPIDVPKNVLEAAQNTKCIYLRYVADERDKGGYFYNQFSRLGGHPDVREDVEDLETARKMLLREFKQENDAGYPKDYRPQLVDEEDTSMPGTQPSPETPAEGGEDTFEPDDDLPF